MYKHLTYLFRHELQLDSALDIQSLSFDLLVDDGAVIYVNGVEVVRAYMPSGTIRSNTTASSIKLRKD